VKAGSGDELRDVRMVWGTRMPGGVASGAEGRRSLWTMRGGGGAADVRMVEVLDGWGAWRGLRWTGGLVS
jgi:hypothetical protein